MVSGGEGGTPKAAPAQQQQPHQPQQGQQQQRAAGSGGSGGSGGGSGGGRAGGRRGSEKSTPVAAGEVVGRPLAVWSQKLLDWPKAVVAGYRPESGEHLVRYADPAAAASADQPPERWVKLGALRFQWLREQPAGAAPNPTAAGAPSGEGAVGRRLKVFWPGMARWYQGKVQSFDAASGKHLIKYRDGDTQELALRHEAVIWVDAGPMPPGARPPLAPTPPAGSKPRQAAPPKPPPAMTGPAAAAKGRSASPAAAKRPRLEEGSSGDERLRSNKSSATREAGLPAAAAAAAAAPGTAPAKDHPASGEPAGAAAGGAGCSSNQGSAYSTGGQSLEGDEDCEGRPASSSSSEGESEEEDDGDSSERAGQGGGPGLKGWGAGRGGEAAVWEAAGLLGGRVWGDQRAKQSQPRWRSAQPRPAPAPPGARRQAW